MSDRNGQQPTGGDSAGDESFEDMLGALEAVVGELEEGNLSLGATIETFQQGMNLARRCQQLLAQAELRISQIETESEADSADENQHANDFLDVPF
jgi:exodeoxyribonuclease VII small subunit